MVELLEMYKYALNETYKDNLRLATIMGNRDKNNKIIKIKDIYE
jgi:hypothetical protein